MRALFLVVVLGYLHRAFSNVIGIDFGSDSFKVAIVQPGSPLDIVTNFQSKRKTPNSISFYREERLFGSDSIALMARKPDVTYSKIYRVLGKSPEHPHVKELTAQYFPHEIYKNETTGFTCLKEENTYYTPEELIAMIMQHAKDMTKNHGGKAIKDCVITVPSHFTYHERKALYNAADIADLRILTLVEENTAAAIHYGMDRVFEKPNTVLYYNMGASSVQVTIVTYSSYMSKENGKNKAIGQFDVIGKAWDASLGGFNFDVKIADMMAKRFNDIWNKKPSGKDKDIRNFTRPMTRLRVEAVKIKEVLSANAEYPVKAEQLHAEVDLVTKITRHEFEIECQDLFDRLTHPIDQALMMANITLNDIHSVELLGGSVRIPKVKQILDNYFKPNNIDVGQHLNGDEAMALGAAFRAANLSTSFKVRKVGQSDINNFGISIHLETLPHPEAPVKGGLFGLFGGGSKKDKATTNIDHHDKEEKWNKVAEIFPSKLTLSSKLRTVTFPYDEDIICKIEYNDISTLPVGTDTTIAVLNITGITDFAKEASKKNASPPKIHLSFGMDGDGIVTLVKAEATSELPSVNETTTSATEENKDISSSSSSESSTNEDHSASTTSTTTESSATNSTESGASDDTTTTGTNSTDTNTTKSDKKTKKDKKSSKKDKAPKKETTLRQVLHVVENPKATHPAQWTNDLIQESRDRLKKLQAADDARKAKEAALNELEAYIYKVKNRFMDEETAISKVSTAEQREEVEKVSKESEEWLEETNSQKTSVTEYITKLKSIKDLAEPIFHRVSESIARPAAIKKLQDNINGIKEKIAIWPEKFPQINTTEIEDILKLINKVEVWIESKQEEQLNKELYEKPAFDSNEVAPQLKPVTVLYERLIRKPKPAPKVVKVNVTDSNETETVKVESESESEKGDNSSSTSSEEESTSSSSSTEDAKTSADEL